MGRADSKHAVHNKGDPLPPPAPPSAGAESGSPPAPDAGPAPRVGVRWTWALVVFLWSTTFGFLFLYEFLTALMRALFSR